MSLQAYQTPTTTTTMDPIKVVLGSLAFAVFWVLAVFPAVPLLPIGRTAGSLLAAILMVIFKVISPTQAYASIDLSILGLLFGTMVVSVYLDRADAFKYLGMLLSWKSQGGKDLICRVCLISAVTSAFFTNDTSCIVLTEFVLKVARQNNLPPLPFLLALASSANIGSSATPIGNPQNLVIATDSGISFCDFLVGMLPAVLIGASLNAALLLCMYWKQLSSCYQDDGDEENINGGLLGEDGNDTGFYQLSLHTVSSSDAQQWSSRQEVQRYSYVNLDLTRFGTQSGHQSEGIRNQEEWKRVLRKSCVYVVTIGMMIALVLGTNMSWTAITAALVLVIVYFKDAQPCLEKVSYSLLIFFCGMFMTIDGFNETGIPKSLWEVMEPYSRIDTAGGVAVAACVILILCNLISNVPTVLLMGGYMAASAEKISPEYVKKAWLTLAWVSTVAGNLSLVGSAANMIVCEKACRVHHLPFNLSFWTHLKFGLPSTLIVTAVGLTLIT